MKRLCYLSIANPHDLAIVSRQLRSLPDKPRVWEAPLVIPTYELNPPNPYPALLDWQRRKWRPVYPYPFLDSLGNEKKDKTWKAVYLENEYLKVTVLPELGGHVYQIFDKTTKPRHHLFESGDEVRDGRVSRRLGFRRHRVELS